MTSSAPLAGRHAVVTGAGRGIGAAIADELARLGATVTLMGRDAPRLSLRANAVAQSHRVPTLAQVCDVADAASVADAFGAATERFGAAHILVNNAGQAAAAPFTATTLELWNRMIAVNLTGAFLCMRQVLPAMLAAKDGRIVNIASLSAIKAYQTVAAYTASKAGLIGLTRAVAAETAKSGVTVNAVCPGYTDTDMAASGVDNLVAAGKTVEDARRAIARSNPRGTLIEPSEVAATVGWLCLPESAAINGQAIVLAGGNP